MRIHPQARLSPPPIIRTPLLNQAEAERYSVLSAVRAAWSMARGMRPEPSFETEVHGHLLTSLVREEGFRVPLQVLCTTHPTALAVSTVSTESGGALTNRRDVGPYTAVFRRGWLGRAGVPVFTGLNTSSYPLPVGDGAPSGDWIDQEEDAPEGQTTITEHELSPKTWGTYLNLTRKFIVTTRAPIGNLPNGEELVRLEMQRAAADAIDLAAMVGPGGHLHPLGLLADADIPLYSLATNGAALSYSALVDMLGMAGAVGTVETGLAWVTNNATRKKMMTTRKSADGSGDGFLWEPPTVAGADGSILGLPAYVTRSVPSDLSKGSSEGSCSAIALGSFYEAAVGVWGDGITIIPSRAESWFRGGLSLACLVDVDVAFRRRAAFVVALDVLTS